MTIEQDMFPIRFRTRYTAGLIDQLMNWLTEQTQVDYPRELVESSLASWMESRVDRMVEDLPATLTSPHLAEAQEFRRILEDKFAHSRMSAEVHAPQEALSGSPTVFTGAVPFSKEKLGAMIAYLARQGKDIYKTNLNKLLFYGDLSFYYLYGRGISGATYVNLPYGPVPNEVEGTIDELVESGKVSRVEVPEFGASAQRIVAAGGDDQSLDTNEINVLDWVVANYGNMSASELSEYSHHEKAYKFTRPLEPIAYEYGKFFKKLPDKRN